VTSDKWETALPEISGEVLVAKAAIERGGDDVLVRSCHRAGMRFTPVK
jgi:hypothetical protein